LKKSANVDRAQNEDKLILAALLGRIKNSEMRLKTISRTKALLVAMITTISLLNSTLPTNAQGCVNGTWTGPGVQTYSCTAPATTVYAKTSTYTATSLKGDLSGDPYYTEGAACIPAGAQDAISQSVTLYSINRASTGTVMVNFTSPLFATQVGIFLVSCQEGFIGANLTLHLYNGTSVTANCPQDNCTASKC
ncbi:hypothetical protein Vafri_14059, partial [Volvox africanus]